MRVTAHLESSGGQLAGGLMSLLTGGVETSFASLLGGEEVLQPRLDEHALPERHQGERERGTSQKETSEHAHKTRSSDDRSGSALNGKLQVNVVAGDSRSIVTAAGPSWNIEPKGHSSELEGPSRAVRVTRGAANAAAIPSTDRSSDSRKLNNGVEANISPDLKGDEIEDADKPQFANTVREVKLQTKNVCDVGGSLQPSPPGVQATSVLEGDDSETVALGEASNSYNNNPVADSSNVTVMNKPTGQTYRLESAGDPLHGTQTVATTLTGNANTKGEEPVGARRPPSTDSQAVAVSETGGVMTNHAGTHGGQTRHDASDESGTNAEANGASERRSTGANVEVATIVRADSVQQAPARSDPQSSASAGMHAGLREAGIQHASDANATRMVANAMQGELHVGVHTEAFGRVTIQTNSGAGQFSAQVLLEDSKQSAALAMHLPAAEQRITQQHGLEASVRIASNSHSGSRSDSSAGGQRGMDANGGSNGERYGSRPFRQDVARPVGFGIDGLPGVRHNLQVSPGRLDVTV